MFIKLFEMGYAPIALRKDKKIPIFNGWQQFSNKLPTEDLVNCWETDYQKGLFNIGVVCGRASDLIAIDIDVDDKELMSIVPQS